MTSLFTDTAGNVPFLNSIHLWIGGAAESHSKEEHTRLAGICGHDPVRVLIHLAAVPWGRSPGLLPGCKDFRHRSFLVTRVEPLRGWERDARL